MLSIQKIGQEIHLEESFPEWETVVFGVRPCDARGVKLMDAVFLDTNPVDFFTPGVARDTTLIGVACQSPGSNCFCTSVGGAPDDFRNVDIMLFEMEGSYLAEPVTEKGRYLIPGGEWKETRHVSQYPFMPHSSQFQQKTSGRNISITNTGPQ